MLQWSGIFTYVGEFSTQATILGVHNLAAALRECCQSSYLSRLNQYSSCSGGQKSQLVVFEVELIQAFCPRFIPQPIWPRANCLIITTLLVVRAWLLCSLQQWLYFKKYWTHCIALWDIKAAGITSNSNDLHPLQFCGFLSEWWGQWGTHKCCHGMVMGCMLGCCVVEGEGGRWWRVGSFTSRS